MTCLVSHVDHFQQVANRIGHCYPGTQLHQDQLDRVDPLQVYESPEMANKGCG